ncbi:MAG: hypothetical protein N4A33_04715 [Bacteriovoracaceae bacterium]|jgi:hypothetical protein|nr:hypothetical protein [Bacteriovoracaceae bacterium]
MFGRSAKLLALTFFVYSCGKNPHIFKADTGQILSPGSAQTSECVTEVRTINPSEYRKSEQGPFIFRTIKMGQYTRVITDAASGLKHNSVKHAQVKIDYDLSQINKLDGDVTNVNLSLKGSQITKIYAYRHLAQLCHTQNNTCDGDKKSVRTHIAANGFKWITDSFTKKIESIERTNEMKRFFKKYIDISYNMNELFGINKKSLKLSDLVSNYSIYLADDILVKRAKLKIEYRVCD